MLNLLKQIVPTNLLKRRLLSLEYLLDLYFFFATRSIFQGDAFYAYRPFKLRASSDIGLVFFCGIGDAIYGLPAIVQISREVRGAGYRLCAFVECEPSTYANPAVAQLLQATGLFDSINYFHGRDLGYWKYFDWTVLRKVVDQGVAIYPFIYRTAAKVKDRVAEVGRQYGLAGVSEWPAEWPDVQPTRSNGYVELTNRLAGEARVVFLHLETRSGRYCYPHIDDIVERILGSRMLARNILLVVFGNTRVRSRRVISLDPRTIPLADQIALVRAHATVIVAINSYLWPIARMLKKRLLGIHYLDSDDGHQFWFQGARFLTPSRRVYEHIGEGVLAVEGRDFRRLEDNPRMVEYSPAAIYDLVAQEICLWNG